MGCGNSACAEPQNEANEPRRSQSEIHRSHDTPKFALERSHVVIASPAFEELAASLRQRLRCEDLPEGDGPAVSWERFKSGDPNTRFHWRHLSGRRVVYLFDTVDQSRLFEQLSLIQTLQGFPLPDGADAANKWKTYVEAGDYTWCRVGSLTVILPWFRPCQMERTSRWQLVDGKWTNGDGDGLWCDVPTAQTMVRLLSATGPPVPAVAPKSGTMDGMPLPPAWRPPFELIFVELHEEDPVKRAGTGVGATLKMERFAPHFLGRFKETPAFEGAASAFVLFPDRGAFDRYGDSVTEKLGLAPDHILYIKKTRVGDKIGQEQKLFFSRGPGESGEKSAFLASDSVLIIDDFTNSGSTLFGAVSLVRKLAGADIQVSIFVSHLVSAYDPSQLEGFLGKLHGLGPKCKFFTTNSIPLTTDLIKHDDQVEVISIADFLADMVTGTSS